MCGKATIIEQSWGRALVLTHYFASQSPENVFKMQRPRSPDSGSDSCNLGRIQDLAFFRTCGPHDLGETMDYRTSIFIILRFIVIAFSEAGPM